MIITAITGANSGIGFAAARELSKHGHQIIMLCRSEEKGQNAKQKIIDYSNNENVHLYLCDLADLNSIAEAVEQLNKDFDKIDNLVNNAGVILMKHVITNVGLEKTLTVNHLGHFLLTDLLLPLIQKSEDPRIINTSSGAHYSGDFDFSDINYEKGSYSTFPAYSRSKLANVLFTRKLDKLLKDNKINISVYSLHPGVIASNFAKNNGILAKVAMLLIRPFARSITAGAQPIIYLATDNNIKSKSGEYFVDDSSRFTKPNIVAKKSKQISYDENTQNRLWQLSRDYIKKWKPDFNFNYDSLKESNVSL